MRTLFFFVYLLLEFIENQIKITQFILKENIVFICKKNHFNVFELLDEIFNGNDFFYSYTLSPVD